jgi:hypothetical protein
MAKWVAASVLDNGLNDVKSNATKMLLIAAYSAGDNYATVVGNKLAEATMTGTDFVLSSSGSNRVLTTAAGKSGTATGTNATPDLHIAFTNGTDTVYWVTNETSDQPITSGNTINFPQCILTSAQPT